MPLEIQLDGRRSRSHRKKTLRDAMSELLAIARRRSVRIIRLRTSLRTDADELIAGHLLSTAATHSLEFRAVIDLTRSADELFGDMRKGHRQQIRWGQANMQVQVVDSTTGDRCSFDAYRALHAAAAGRITRGAEAGLRCSMRSFQVAAISSSAASMGNSFQELSFWMPATPPITRAALTTAAALTSR